MKTPSVGHLVNDVDELVKRLVGRLDLVVKRTELGPDGIDYMVLAEDVDGQERTVWSTFVGWNARRRQRQSEIASVEQDRVAFEIWELCSKPDEQPATGGAS